MKTPTRIAADRLKSFIERIEKLEEDRKAIGGDIRDVYSEAKGGGFDVKTMRKIVALRKMDAADREEADAILAAYADALGMSTSAHVTYMSVVEGGAAMDERTLKAIELLTKNVSIRMVVQQTGMGQGSVQRLRQTLIRQGVPIGGVPRVDGTPPHDPTTGEITETDRAQTPDARPRREEKGIASPADPIPSSSAGASSPQCATDCDPVAASTPPLAVPAGEANGGPGMADRPLARSVDAAPPREGQDSADSDDMPPIPDALRVGTEVNRRARAG